MPDSRFDGFLRTACTAVVTLFGCWTLLANAVVISGGSFTDLRRLMPVVLLAAAVILFFLHSALQARTIDDSGHTSPLSDPSDDSKTLITLLFGAGLAAIYAFGSQYVIFWGLTCLYLGVVYLRKCNTLPLRLRAASSDAWNISPFVMAALTGTLATVLLNRPDYDESLYLNMAASVLDDPNAPIFATDSLHGISGTYYFPTYRIHAFELFYAFIAWAGNMEPIRVSQLLLAPLLAFVSVFTAARFFRLFLPHRWGWATFCFVVTLLVLRETHQMYGSFAFVRMFAGKCVFLTAIIPLIVTHAVEFFVRPRFRTWFLLALTQVAAVGFTANAL